MMYHEYRDCDIGRRQPIADCIGTNNRYRKPPPRWVQINANRIHAKLRL